MAGVKQFDRGEVLDRAMALFWRRGYLATSISDLVSDWELGWHRIGDDGAASMRSRAWRAEDGRRPADLASRPSLIFVRSRLGSLLSSAPE